MNIDEKAVFLAALALPDAKEREAYLQEACASQSEVLGHLRELLSAHEESQGPLDRRLVALGVTVDAAHTETPGTVIGPYKLLQQIGEGGMGTVYMAEQTQPVHRKVALKVIKPGMDSRQVVARFEAERQALAIMDHPNIAKVFDGGATPSGRPYFVMELVKGVPITEFCDQNHLTPRERVELFVSVCQAVQHAHQKGIIHRDLKPSNVLVSRHDTTPVVKVIDFGVAKALGQALTEKTLFTGVAQMIGTPLYMSPEQAGMSDLDVDTRSDIYALGVLLYELLTGTTPFDRERLGKAGYDEIRRIIREEEPAKPSTRISTLGQAASTVSANRQSDPRRLSQLFRGDLDWIVMKALEKDRNRRYETANSLALDVQRYLADEPVQACPPSVGYRLRKFVRRNKRALATVALVGVMLFVAAAAVIAGALWAMVEADARAQVEANAKKQLEFNLYLRNIPLAQVEATFFNWGRVEDLLEECPKHLRGWEWNYLKRLPDAPPLDATARVSGGISANLDLAFSPDGRFLAGPGPDGTVTVWDFNRGKPRSLKHAARVLCVAFRPPDGRLLVSAAGDGTLKFWDPESGQEVRDEVKGHAGEIVGMTFHPDGQLLATVGADEKVRLWDVATGKPRFEFATVYRDQARMLRRAAFSPDGRLFACGAGSTVKIWDLTTGAPIRTLEGHEDLVYSVAFSPKGDRLLSVSWDLTVKVWDLAAGGAERFSVRGHASAAWAVEFSPDGSLLAVAGGVADPTVKVHDARTGALIHRLQGHATRVGCVAFHPGGRRLASCSLDQTVRIWELDHGQEVLTLRGHSNLVTRVLFDPKGWRLASSGDDGKLLIWDGTPASDAHARPCVSLSGHTRQVFCVGFSPDGRELVSGGEDRTVRVWDVAAACARHTLKGHADTVFAVALGGDGLLVSGSYDRTTRVWDARTGALVQTVDGPEARARGLALSADGKLVVTSSITPPFQIWRWDVRQGLNGPRIEKRLPPLAGHSGPAFVVAVSPGNKYVASAGTDGQIILSDAATAKQLSLLRTPGRERAWAVAFRPPDGSQLAVGCSEKRAMIWDLGASGFGDGKREPTAILTGHSNDVYSVAYSPDGRWLASASWNEVIIWDTSTAGKVREIHRLGGFRGLVWSVAWSPDRGRLLLAVGGGRKDVGTIELWDMTDLPAKAVTARPGT
jgi:WD40 repeat protein/serine/threonine protein kinase